MSDKSEIHDTEFPELIGARRTLLPELSNVEELAIYPQETIVLPFETMTLEITDERAQKLFQTAHDLEKYVGIVYQPKDEDGLPAPGSIGVAALVKEVTKTGFGNLRLFWIRGHIRFRLDEYVETDQPYPVAKITFFEDEDDEWQEKQIPRQLAELQELLRECLKRGRAGVPPQINVQQLPETITFYDSETYSFFFWVWVRLKPEVRQFLISLRSTYERLVCLNNQFRTGLDETQPEHDARFN